MAAALGGAGGHVAPYTRSKGPAPSAATVVQTALGIVPTPAPLIAESLATLVELFRTAPPSNELHVLDAFTNPSFAVQPAIVPNVDVATVKASLESTMDENLLSLIELPVEKNYTVKIASASGHIVATTPVGDRSEYTLNPYLLANVKDSYSPDELAGNVPIYFFVITNFGHASIIIYSTGMLFSVGLGLNYGSWAEHSARPTSLESIFTGRADFLGDGVLLSPDYLVQPASLHPKRGTPYAYKIIDIGLFKTKHAERILSLIPKSDTTTLSHFDETGKHIYKFSHYEIDIKKKYMYLSLATVARITGHFYNCVSFAQTIFRERVDCTVARIGPVDPYKCHSTLGDVSAVRDIFIRYMEDYIQGNKLERTLPQLDYAVSGGARRRRSRRNKLRRSRKASRRYRK